MNSQQIETPEGPIIYVDRPDLGPVGACGCDRHVPPSRILRCCCFPWVNLNYEGYTAATIGLVLIFFFGFSIPIGIIYCCIYAVQIQPPPQMPSSQYGAVGGPVVVYQAQPVVSPVAMVEPQMQPQMQPQIVA